MVISSLAIMGHIDTSLISVMGSSEWSHILVIAMLPEVPEGLQLPSNSVRDFDHKDYDVNCIIPVLVY
jgi:hypothetical protein